MPRFFFALVAVEQPDDPCTPPRFVAAMGVTVLGGDDRPRPSPARGPTLHSLDMAPQVREALRLYRARLDRDLPGRARRVVLFGSHARDEAHEESDVDVLVVLSHATHRERVRAIDLGGEIGLELGLPVAPVVLTQAEWDELVRRERLLVSEIGRDGVEA